MRFLVTERRNGKIVGIAGILRMFSKPFFIVVKSEYQNQKIGQKLTRKVIEHARKKKYHYITLDVFQSNLRAVHIYKKLGFTVLFTNLLDSRKNYCMILPLDFKGLLHKRFIWLIKYTFSRVRSILGFV